MLSPRHRPGRHLLLLPLLLLLMAAGGCARTTGGPETVGLFLAPVPDGEESTHAPAFLVKAAEQGYNRIGTPAIRRDTSGQAVAIVDPAEATLYYEASLFTTPKGGYRNLVYRLHFPEVPFRLTSPNLTAGKNPGLLLIYTLDAEERLLLVTTLHTCGCYLAFLPTTHLAPDAFPAHWPKQEQTVYGYRLPSLIRPPTGEGQRLAFVIESETHRIGGVRLHQPPAAAAATPMRLTPLGQLHRLPFEGGEDSFFETEGPRAGYVRDNGKILERLLLGWLALDWRVGEDKAYGRDDHSPAILYTSLKFWARKASDLKDFPTFLAYWGWRL
jgi:hypothetical protein